MCGSHRDHLGNTVHSDTVQFYYDSSISYSFTYRKDWKKVIQFSQGRWQQDSIIVLHAYNISSADTINLETQTQLTIRLHKTDRSQDISNLLEGRLLLPGKADSVLISPSLFKRYLGSEKGVYVAEWRFLEDPYVGGGINSLHID